MSPSSCLRCSRSAPLVTPSGLCATCAATDETAALRRPGPLPGPEPATASFLLPIDPSTAPAPDASGRPLRSAPPGYDLCSRLGGGGMGDVYLAREHLSERAVAMKFLRDPGDPAALERFVVELRVLAKLDHPNIVRVYASDFLRAEPYFTMEYVPGGSLAKADGERSVADAVRLVRTVAAAIAVAHGANVIHRDLKPSNILIDAAGAPKIADFGLAKRLDESDPLTVASGALGTPGYMPPEQVSRKNGEVGAWSDVYGLGATLYHTLVGRAPFVGDSIVDTITKVLAEPPERVRRLRPEVPLALEGVVMKCLEKDPKDRYQTVAELLADLDRYEAGLKPVAPPLTPARRVARWAKRNRRGLAGAAAALLLAVAALGAGWLMAPIPPPPPPPVPAVEARPDPLADIEKELLAGRPVKLIDGAPPRWIGWIHGGPELLPSRAWKDAVGFETGNVWMFQLVRDPMCDHYRLEAEISNDQNGRIDPFVGLFVGYRRFGGRRGEVAGRFQGAQFSEYRTTAAIDFPDEVHPHHVKVCNNVTLWRGNGQPAFLGLGAIRSWEFEPKNTSGVRRKLAIEVTPNGIEYFWHGPFGWVSIGTLTPAELADETRNSQRRLDESAPGTGITLTEFDPRSPLGVYASDATVSIYSVTLTPLKKKP